MTNETPTAGEGFPLWSSPVVGPTSDLVEVSRAELAHLRADAGAWRLLNRSPHVEEILAEWIEWAYRADLRATSWSIAALENQRWQDIAGRFPGASATDRWVSYAGLRQRRNTYTTPALTPEQIRAEAAASWARYEQRAA